jgi:chromatin segregation and condensation protein Rec8/ScpA/Scc1 (kleisin family)
MMVDAFATAARGSRVIHWQRSVSSATFVASLELAKQGDVMMGQGEGFELIHVGPAQAVGNPS